MREDDTWGSKLKLFTDSGEPEDFMRSCLVVGRVFLVSGQKMDVSRGCLSDRVAMLQTSNAEVHVRKGRRPKACRAAVMLPSGGAEA